MGTYLGSERVILNMPKERDSGILGTIIDRTISEYENPFVSEIGTYAFANCSNLASVNLPQVTSIRNFAFYHCSSLASISLPQATTIGEYAFDDCETLISISLPQVTIIEHFAFAYCYNLLSLYLLGSSIPTLTTTAFNSTPISTYTTSTGGIYGSIYVPASLYSDYLIASGWSTYSERIVSIGD